MAFWETVAAVGLGGLVKKGVDKVIDFFSPKKESKHLPEARNSGTGSTALAPIPNRPSQQEVIYVERESRREREWLGLQQELKEYKKAEIEANVKIAVSEAQRQEWALQISEENLKLKQQELALVREKLQHEKQVSEWQKRALEYSIKLREKELSLIQSELEDRRELSRLYLDLLREREAKSVELKLHEIQSHWDENKWAGILSQQDMQKIFMDSREKHRLVMIVSQPHISPSCPKSFIDNLPSEVSSELKRFLEEYYSPNDQYAPVQFFGKFFERSIFDAEVKKLEMLLSPIPAATIYSSITDDTVYLHVSFAKESEALSETISWNWEEEKERLITAGQAEKNSLKQIRQAIVEMHKIVAAFLADLYYLNVNPNHEIRVLASQSSNSPDWMKELFNKLHKLQSDSRAVYQGTILELAAEAKKREEEQKQKDEEAARRQAEKEAERKRQEEEAAKIQAMKDAERKQQEEENLRLGEYVELRDLLAAGKWREADEKTAYLMQKEVYGLQVKRLDQTTSKQISPQKVRLVDDLWTRFSNGQFGFSIQNQIYAECSKNRTGFTFHVGWSPNNTAITIRYSINTFKGHLPANVFEVKVNQKANWDVTYNEIFEPIMTKLEEGKTES